MVDVNLVVEFLVDREARLAEGVYLVAISVFRPVENGMIAGVSDQRCVLVGVVCW